MARPFQHPHDRARAASLARGSGKGNACDGAGVRCGVGASPSLARGDLQPLHLPRSSSSSGGSWSPPVPHLSKWAEEGQLCCHCGPNPALQNLCRLTINPHQPIWSHTSPSHAARRSPPVKMLHEALPAPHPSLPSLATGLPPHSSPSPLFCSSHQVQVASRPLTR